MTCDKCRIEYEDVVLCPLHEAAGDLLAACMSTVRVIELSATVRASDRLLLDKLKAAIEKARRTA